MGTQGSLLKDIQLDLSARTCFLREPFLSVNEMEASVQQALLSETIESPSSRSVSAVIQDRVVLERRKPHMRDERKRKRTKAIHTHLSEEAVAQSHFSQWSRPLIAPLMSDDSVSRIVVR